MKKALMSLGIVSSLIGETTDVVTFNSGDVIRASEMNSNFSFLVNENIALKSRISDLEAEFEKLKSVIYPNLDSGDTTPVISDVVTVDGVFQRDALTEIVTDTSTGLMFSDESRTIQKMTWSNASSFYSNLELGDFSDWRMPTKEELINIVGETIFQNKTSGNYWDGYVSEHTSRGYDYYDDYGYHSVNWATSVGKFNGVGKDRGGTNLYYVVCVRETF
jgi:dynactin complex subunit